MPEPNLQNEEQQAELVAYLDGELDERAAHDVETRLQRDAGLRVEADAFKKTWELLDFLPQPEPSATFTTRTLDKLAVLRPSPSQAAAALSRTTPTATASVVFPVAARRVWPQRLGWAAAAALLFVVSFWGSGLLTKRSPQTHDPREVEEQMAKDLRVLDNLNLYQYGDDLNFLFGLDQPDLFGDENSGR